MVESNIAQAMSTSSPAADTTFSGHIPTVDLSDPDQDNLVRSIAAAGKEWGIFQVVNHGISGDLIEKLKTVGREFFELPAEEKEKYAQSPGAQTTEGYGSSLQKDHFGQKSWLDFFFHMIWPPSIVNYNSWPRNPKSYREVNEEYAENIVEVADKLLKWLSLGLGLEEHALKEACGGEAIEYRMKMNYYPPCTLPELTLGVVAHTDFSHLTIMVTNEISGLQILKDDHWIDVKYIPDSLIVHIGDQIKILSNGQYKSVLHRSTVDKENTRMSWPIFVRPPVELELGPIPQLVDQDNPPKYKSMKFKDYISSKYKSKLRITSMGL